MNKKALIAMSGGVDSTVAAYLMVQAGWDCIGCTMRLFDNPDAGLDREGSCCSLDDTLDAKDAARRLGIPHYTFNLSDCFRAEVMQRFAAEYERGRTPNPCVDCNRFLKFGLLWLRARELGCDAIVTGHYARVVREDGRCRLQKAADPARDQSYFLYCLDAAQLAHVVFPLGALTKPEVRAIAEAQGFVNARKHDSQDICFVPDGDYAAAIRRLTGREPKPGNFVNQRGEILGTHRGLIHYTVGQRRGLGLSFPEPYYVTGLDPAANTVTLGPKAALFSDTCRVPRFAWSSGEVPAGPVRCAVKIRYRHPEQPATVTPTPDGGALVVFDEPQRAITPGQSAVAYDGGFVLGGGEIA